MEGFSVIHPALLLMISIKVIEAVIVRKMYKARQIHVIPFKRSEHNETVV